MANEWSIVDISGGAEKFKRYQSAVERIIPKDMELKRYWTMYVQMMSGFANNPKITDKQSILTCLINAPKLGLIPDPVMGQIYFIPYKGVLTYQVGYKGMVALSYRTGKISGIRTGLVYEKDKWSYHEDENGQHYHFEPNFKEKDRGRELFAYSIFTDTKGFHHVHVMESHHIDEIKKMVLARMAGSMSPWSNPLFEPEIRKKTCLRRHWKMEPMSVEIAKVIEHEEENERGEVKKETVDNVVDGVFEEVPPTMLPNKSALSREPGTDPDEPKLGKDGKDELPY